MIKIIPFVYNNDPDELLANTYVLVDSLNFCVVVDPSKNNENIKNFIIKNNYILKGVLLTHGHFDHFGGAEVLVKAFNVPLFIHALDEIMLKDEKMNCSVYMSRAYQYPFDVEYYSNKEELSLLNENIEVIPTPYHTKGSVSLYLKESKAVFTGDSLFYRGVGRSDLPNNDSRKQYESVSKLLSLPEDTKVYPGHGPFTSIKEERVSNQFVK